MRAEASFIIYLLMFCYIFIIYIFLWSY